MYGDGVNIAARIEPLAIGGGICLSDTVYAQVRNKMDVELIKLNSPDLKHIEVLDSVRDRPAFQQLLVTFNCVPQYKVARETLARMIKEQAAKK